MDINPSGPTYLYKIWMQYGAFENARGQRDHAAGDETTKSSGLT